MFYKQKLKHSYHFFANAHEISYKSNIIRRNGYTWKCLRKMRKGNKLKKGEKYDLKTFLKINHNLFFVAYCENIDLFLFQRSFTVITFIYYPRQESSSNHTSLFWERLSMNNWIGCKIWMKSDNFHFF